ncbi:serine/threonine-protein kinase PknH/PknJ [Mycobacterium sp. E2733]|uniref:serine/threonine-protein kinase PknH/PknJ n=1 Tax=Mycobacterium sp. E2733 TaxID=1834138 RepID=UPI000A68A564|nr:serine/threonine-protein kinase PknH/PknJ [Mycobacterium sp. E2733]
MEPVQTPAGSVVEGTPFGRYRLVELFGRGGMGEVWRAYDTAMDRVVALKMLLPNVAEDPAYAERFRREAHAAAGLNEPHVIPIYDFGEIDGRLFVTMRLIEGRDLQTLLAEGPLEPARAIGIIDQIASALNAAHRVGLVHRDVKPSNILIAENDFAYLIDFGIARAVGEAGLTSAGAVIGTWAYMAPERISTGQSDPRSDIYALACVLYECLTGSPPFPGESLEQQITAHLTTPPPRPSAMHAGVPALMDTVIATGMAKDPDQRYPSTIELARAARAAITTPLPRTGPPPPAPSMPPAGPPSAPPGYFQQATGVAAHPPVYSAPWGAYRTEAPFAAAPPGAIEHIGARAEPWWQRHAIALTAVCALIVTAVAVPTIFWATSRSSAQNRPSLLSVKDINTLMGRSDLELIDRYTELEDSYYSVSPPECDPVNSVGDKAAYSPAGITNITAEQLSQTGNRGKESVTQLLGQAPSATAAQQFLTRMTSAWRACDGKQYADLTVKITARITDTAPHRATALLDIQGDFVGGKNLLCEHTFAVDGDAVAEAVACVDDIANKSKIISDKILHRGDSQR